jgi:hypothetical protein
MALVPKETKVNAERAPWRGLVAGVLAAAMFVVILTFAAWCTNDTTRGVPRHDAGPDAAVVDAGSVDAGVLDAGVVEGPELAPVEAVPGPPVDPKAVAEAMVPVLEDCLKAALRFDPSLGGKAKLHVVAGHGSLAATLPGAPSPVLARCVATNGKLGYSDAPSEPVAVDAVIVLDGTRAAVRIDHAELAP